MRTRHVIAAISTALGLVLVLRFKTPAGETQAAAGARARPPGVEQPAPADTGASASGQGDVQPAPTPKAAGAYRDGTWTGRDVLTRFGDVQVKVIVQAGRIADVQPLQLPYDHRRSLVISREAAPLLHDEVLQTQSANIDILSGATYTSEAYARSVQAALDQAH